jgi:hypothetical protein
LKVTADGAEVGMVAGFAKRFPPPDGEGLMVSMYDHGEMTCAGYVKPSRPVKDGELEIRAYVTKETTAVGVNYFTQAGAKALLVENPRQAGQKGSICVAEPVEYAGQATDGRKVVVQGLLTGDLCEAAAP